MISWKTVAKHLWRKYSKAEYDRGFWHFQMECAGPAVDAIRELQLLLCPHLPGSCQYTAEVVQAVRSLHTEVTGVQPPKKEGTPVGFVSHEEAERERAKLVARHQRLSVTLHSFREKLHACRNQKLLLTLKEDKEQFLKESLEVENRIRQVNRWLKDNPKTYVPAQGSEQTVVDDLLDIIMNLEAQGIEFTEGQVETIQNAAALIEGHRELRRGQG